MRSPSAAPILTLCALIAGGCAGQGPAPEPAPARTEAQPAEPLVAASPEPPAPEGSALAETPPPEEVDSAPEPAQASAEEGPIMRDDGRPNWWFDGVRLTEEGASRLCAEALGVTIRDARGRAIEAARSELSRRLEVDGDEQLARFSIELAWVWPLPNGGAEGGARYAGYVLASARRVTSEK